MTNIVLERDSRGMLRLNHDGAMFLVQTTWGRRKHWQTIEMGDVIGLFYTVGLH